MRYRFGDYTLDIERYELWHAGQPVPLQPKVFDLLACLLHHRDHVVTRHALFEQLWPEQFVSDDALERVVAAARRAVGDSGRTQQTIKTVHGRGYRFVAAAVEDRYVSSAVPPASPAAASSSMPTPAPPDFATVHHDTQHAIDRERKQVTVLVCAFDSAQGWTEGLEPETLYTLRQHAFTLCQRTIQRYGGTVQHFVAEGFLAFFGVPVAQEDHAYLAVLAAQHIHECIRQGRNGAEFIPNGTWVARMGLHTGEVVIGRIGDDLRRVALTLGDTTQVADQLLRLAAPGEVVLSRATARCLPAWVRLEVREPGGDCSLLGAPPSYRVVDVPPRYSALGWQGRRILRQFVGREGDMATLQALLAQVEEGYGQVVGITGEPGIGKSRLLYEFQLRIHPRPLTYLTGRCVSYGQATPYQPLLDIFRQACGLRETDPSTEVTTKIQEYLEALGLEPQAWVPYLLHLFGLAEGSDDLTKLGPQAMRYKTFEVLRQLSLHASRQRPLVLEIEDLHWIDPTSEEWLMTLIERLARVPILLLVSYRPGYRPPWINKSYTTQLALQRLTAKESRQVVQAICHPTSVTEPLMQELVTKADGNPFFLEELAQTLVQHGDRTPSLGLPKTIEAVIAARIDQLPPEAKHLLRLAAVIGMEVPVTLLQAVAALPDGPLYECLDDLQGAEFLHETHPTPEHIYTFQHILTQEVTYRSLLRHTQQQTHRQIAEVLAERFPAIVNTQPELLAHHYTAAGLNASAVVHWHTAGQRVSERAAHTEAVHYFTQGLQALATLPDTPERARQELALQMHLGSAVRLVKGMEAPAVARAYRRAWELIDQLEDSTQGFTALWGMQVWHQNRGELQTAQELAKHLLTLAQRRQDVAWLAAAHLALGITSHYMGKLVTARGHLEQSTALHTPSMRHSPHSMYQSLGVSGYFYLALVLWMLGYPDQALVRSQEGFTLAHEQPHLHTRALALYYAAAFHQMRREVRTASEQAEAAIRLATEQGYTQPLRAGTLVRSWARAVEGQAEEGMTQIRQGLAAQRAAGATFAQPRFLALLAEVQGQIGQITEGLCALEQALTLVSGHGTRFYEAELYRLKGELLLKQATSDEPRAVACFQQALDVARHQQAKSWELRTALSLSRLWQQQGKRDAARQLLTPIYTWFTEGFDTADLREAKALLQGLA